MGRLLPEKNGLSSPRLAGPTEEDLIPDRLYVNGEVPTWSQATEKFTHLIQWLEDNQTDAHRALNYDTFTNGWAGAAWSELYRIDQKACQWAESTVLITFSGSYWLDKDSNVFFPPVSYFERLQSSKQARQKALSRALDDVEKWQSIRTIGGMGHNGYPRVFVGLYLSTSVKKELFEPVVQAHIDNCPVAGQGGHSLENVVSINKSPQHNSELIHALGKRIPALGSGSGITSESWQKQKLATTLHGGGWRPYTFGRSI